MLMALVKACSAVLHPHAPEPVSGVRHCLTFSLNGLRFGIDTRMVNEIVRLGILAVPNDMPRCMRALYRHNGVMIPVLDIAGYYGNQPLTQGRRSCLVVIGLGCGKWRRDVGLMVDEVLGVTEFAAASLKPVPEAAHAMIQAGIIDGLLQEGRDMLVMLDGWRLLPDEELEEIAAYMRAL
jgi:chemotaxis signal transduction protein